MCSPEELTRLLNDKEAYNSFLHSLDELGRLNKVYTDSHVSVLLDRDVWVSCASVNVPFVIGRLLRSIVLHIDDNFRNLSERLFLIILFYIFCRIIATFRVTFQLLSSTFMCMHSNLSSASLISRCDLKPHFLVCSVIYLWFFLNYWWGCNEPLSLLGLDSLLTEFLNGFWDCVHMIFFT